LCEENNNKEDAKTVSKMTKVIGSEMWTTECPISEFNATLIKWKKMCLRGNFVC
jgi:hypothetical protein